MRRVKYLGRRAKFDELAQPHKEHIVGQAASLALLGIVRSKVAHLEHATREYQRNPRADGQYNRTVVLMLLGTLYHHRGDIVTALASWQRALDQLEKAHGICLFSGYIGKALGAELRGVAPVVVYDGGGDAVQVGKIDEFVPLPSGAHQRRRVVGQFGQLQVYIFDPYTIALSKIARGFEADLEDVVFMLRERLTEFGELERLFAKSYPGRSKPTSFHKSFRPTLPSSGGESLLFRETNVLSQGNKGTRSFDIDKKRH